MRITYLVICIGIIFLTGHNEILAKRSCGSASCPLNTFTHLKGGWLQLGLSYEYINQDRIYVGSSRSYVGAIPEKHDEVRTLNERTSLRLQLGILDQLGLAINVPFVHVEHGHIHHDSAGDEWELWNFSGLGDVLISGEYDCLIQSKEFEPSLSITLGVKLPSGVTDVKNAAGEDAEVTLQPGNGSTDVVIGVQYRQTIASVPTLSREYSALPIITGASYQITGSGKDDYRFGNTLLAHIGTAYQFANRTSFLMQINGKLQEYADVGLTGEPRENTGGTWIFISPGIGLKLSDSFSGSAYMQLPIYQNVHGIQQTAPFNIALNLNYSFDMLAGGDE